MAVAASCATAAGNAIISRQCAVAHKVCVQGEQIVLHGIDAEAELKGIERILDQAMDALDSRRRMHGTWRKSAVTSAAKGSTEPTRYIPYAWPTTSSTEQHSDFFMWPEPSATPSPTFSPQSSLIFMTSFPNSFPEVFYRSMMHVYEYACQHPSKDFHVRPVMWPREYNMLLEPFSKHAVQPLALYPYQTPQREYDGATFNIRAEYRNRTVSDAYADASSRFHRQRTAPECHEEALVCDFTHPPDLADVRRHLRPLATMQAVLAHASGHESPVQPVGSRMRACEIEGDRVCKLRIAFVRRTGRRLLLNLHELVAACNAWQPQHARCEAIDFSAGLKHSRAMLAKIDVFISPHGGDMVNALALHDGASVIEVLPVNLGGCPCDMFHTMFNSGAWQRHDSGHVHYYRVQATKSLHADPIIAKTFHADLVLSWAALSPLLNAIVYVAGNDTRYTAMTRGGWLGNQTG